MIKRIKKRVLHARDGGGAIDRLLNSVRITALKVKGDAEVVRAGLFFMGRRVDVNRYFPDFLVAGMQKSATSWLDKMLRLHPEIYLPPNLKEVHFFDAFRKRGLKWYLYHFRDAGPWATKGEVTPAYSILTIEQIREIYQFNPDLKVLFMLRNPVQRAWSQIYMDVVRHPGRDDETVGVEEFLTHLKRPAVQKRGRYRAILSNWRQVFPEEQIHIEYYEFVRDEPQKLLQRVFRFLEVRDVEDFGTFPTARKVNPNSTTAPPKEVEAAIMESVGTEIHELYDFLPSPVVSDWLRQLKQYEVDARNTNASNWKP